jgi:diacylglycerol kinase (ATP)
LTTLLIVNPKAGRGSVVTHLDVLTAGRDMEPILTAGPGHATELARRARAEGVETVVAVGGDGTIHEVVNGLLADGPGPDVPTLGIISRGSGGDYAKTFGLPEDPAEAIARIESETPPRLVDAGSITYPSERGDVTRFFCNIAEVGIGAQVVHHAARMPRRLGGAVYFAGFCRTLPTYRRRESTIVMDGQMYRGPLTNLVVAIGQVFGGGMRVAPHADPSDGLFDLQIQFGSKLDYVTGIAKVYRGTHIPHPRIREERAAHVEIECTPDAVIEADGELLGRTPATFSIVPGALRLKV